MLSQLKRSTDFNQTCHQDPLVLEEGQRPRLFTVITDIHAGGTAGKNQHMTQTTSATWW